MRLVVGCPVFNRMWILPAWEDWIRHACANANVTPEFIFVAGPSTDGTTEWCQDIGKTVEVEELEPSEDRLWNERRFEHMAWLRNQLLASVRESEADCFLSIDSDILIHPKALTNLLESAERFDAVGGKCYMSHLPERVPNYGQLTVSGGYRRPDHQDGVVKVDVLMALVLMNPAAYAIDYQTHVQGEDFGWSEAARGLELGYDARLCSKHVMKRMWLEKIDPRCGY